ncbi:MAG: bifunctional heptose 7-phosphate kinase/heptose 1-phosphate adenyltransferase [Roseibacillus sp.]
MKEEQLARLRELKVLVVGDVMLDRYVFGRVSRVSPEAPVPVCEAVEDRAVLGGAGNVCRNLSDFGCQTSIIGLVGKDESSAEVHALCDSLKIESCGLVCDGERPTSVKTRVLGNGQQIVRVDRESREQVSSNIEQALVAEIERVGSDCDAIIVSDYAKGCLGPAVVSKLRDFAQSGMIVGVDPHPNNLQNWSEFSIIKPNFDELVLISGVELNRDLAGDPFSDPSFVKAVDGLRGRWGPEHLLVTLSSNGMIYVGSDRRHCWVPTRAAEVYDVSGAGDTAMSYFTLAIAGGLSGREATEFATMASGLVVRKVGTASLSYEEVADQYKE